MIVTQQFVFVHMHKTGGQTINKIITDCIADHRVIGYHYPVSEIPSDEAHLPVVGIVRNPWDWYVSWYAFNRRPGIRNPLFAIVSNDGKADFRTTVTNLVKLGSSSPQSEALREQLEGILPDTLAGNRGVGLTRSSIRDLAASGSGYLSWLVDRMLGQSEDSRVEVGRFENLQDDFLSIMSRLGVPEADSMRTAFENQARENTSRHSHYSHYYDDELRDLVAQQDRALIERFGYSFEAIKPQGSVYEFPDDAYDDDGRGFRKLLGREPNFLRLNDALDVSGLSDKVASMPAERWAESDREKIFNVHRDTRSIKLVHFEDYKYDEPEYRDRYFEFEDELRPVIDHIAKYYQDNGFVIRAMLARLSAGGKIPEHTDAGYSLMNCHRIHIPLITNNSVEFSVGGEKRRMRVGELWEINNATTHAVVNAGSEDRVHLIVDWIPNTQFRSRQDVLATDQLEGNDDKAANEEMLGRIIAQAHQLHRGGHVDKAEALYRQVLHFDADHVVANNLLGLICLQTRRFDEAAQHIRKALQVSPEDAQAHANLGVALKESGRLEDADRHLREALRLAPGNPKVLNNLGSINFMLGRPDEAIRSFEEALSLQPGYAEVHFNLGSIFLQLRRYEAAAQNLQQCVSLRPDFTEARIRLDKALAQLEQSGNAP